MPDPRRPHAAHDDDDKPEAARGAPVGSRPQDKPQEPRKDAEGNAIVAPVTIAGSVAPHEGEEEPVTDRPDQTVAGGRYQVGDKIVNCDGEVLEDAPKATPAKK